MSCFTFNCSHASSSALNSYPEYGSMLPASTSASRTPFLLRSRATLHSSTRSSLSSINISHLSMPNFSSSAWSTSSLRSPSILFFTFRCSHASSSEVNEHPEYGSMLSASSTCTSALRTPPFLGCATLHPSTRSSISSRNNSHFSTPNFSFSNRSAFVTLSALCFLPASKVPPTTPTFPSPPSSSIFAFTFRTIHFSSLVVHGASTVPVELEPGALSGSPRNSQARLTYSSFIARRRPFDFNLISFLSIRASSNACSATLSSLDFSRPCQYARITSSPLLAYICPLATSAICLSNAWQVSSGENALMSDRMSAHAASKSSRLMLDVAA